MLTNFYVSWKKYDYTIYLPRSPTIRVIRHVAYSAHSGEERWCYGITRIHQHSSLSCSSNNPSHSVCWLICTHITGEHLFYWILAMFVNNPSHSVCWLICTHSTGEHRFYCITRIHQHTSLSCLLTTRVIRYSNYSAHSVEEHCFNGITRIRQHPESTVFLRQPDWLGMLTILHIVWENTDSNT